MSDFDVVRAALERRLTIRPDPEWVCVLRDEVRAVLNALEKAENVNTMLKKALAFWIDQHQEVARAALTQENHDE